MHVHWEAGAGGEIDESGGLPAGPQHTPAVSPSSRCMALSASSAASVASLIEWGTAERMITWLCWPCLSPDGLCTDRHTDRQAHRQTCRHTDRQAGTQTDMQAHGQTGRHAQSRTDSDSLPSEGRKMFAIQSVSFLLSYFASYEGRPSIIT